MRKMIFIGLLVTLSFLLVACRSAPTPAGANSSKPVNITVETTPNPAMMGDIELVLTITDASGNPIEGATVDVTADHTDMSGMGMSGVATYQGGGKYSIKANFEMSGNWRIIVYVRKGELDYKEEIGFSVQ